ncbi:hypothetical protein [Tepidimicrobium xylanilyticum]
MENRLKALEDRVEKVEKKITNIEKEMAKSTTEISVIFKMLNEIEADTKTITSDLQELKLKPAKRWDSIVGTIITVVVSTIIGYFLAKGGF